MPNLKQTIIDNAKQYSDNSVEESKTESIKNMINSLVDSQNVFREQIIDRFDKVNHELHYQAKFISDVEIAIKNIRTKMSESFKNISNSKLESVNSVNILTNEVNNMNLIVKN